MVKLLNKRRIRWAAQIIALLLVGWGIAHAAQKAAQQLGQQQAELEEAAGQWQQKADQADSPAQRQQYLQHAADARQRAHQFWQAAPQWLVAAGLAYGLGMLPAGWFWRESLLRLSQPVTRGRTLYAYCLGHLGKYFPGKAMVIVLRVGALAPLGVLKVATTLTIFLETLTMMAVGSALAAICLLGLQLDYRWTLLAIALMVVTFVPTLPPVLRMVLRKTQRGIEPHLMEDWLARVDWHMLIQGWVAMTITWLLNGASLYFVLRAIPTAEFTEVTWSTLAFSSLGACAMAVVLGFVSFLPGGAGVREVVLSTMLAPIVGPVAALAAAVWIRVVWLLTELLIAAALWLRYGR